MEQFIKKYNNVYWFLIDGLRPDFLHIDKCKTNQNFIEMLLSRATIFNNVVTAGAGTYTSMHSIFTSLLPSYNGVTGWNKKILRNFNQNILTIADYFQMAGYETFRYDDADASRETPMSGFKRWEGSGYRLDHILTHTDMMKTSRRDRFIEEVNLCEKNKFVYHHILLLHELNNKMGTNWKSEDYAKNIGITAVEFKKLYYEYSITDEDLVIISSDHGVMLDVDFLLDGLKNGGRQYEQSAISFFALIGKNIEFQVLSNPISALDEAPTLLHIALEHTSMLGQGLDQYDYIYKGIYRSQMFFRESSSSCTLHELKNSMTSDIFYVRDGRWKYVFSPKEPRSEWLIDLEKHRDYQVNLKDEYPELVRKYNQILKHKFEDAKNFKYKPRIDTDKTKLKKMFSLILQMDYLEDDTIESLLDMSGPYYEIVVQNSVSLSKYRNQYKVQFVEEKGLEPGGGYQGEWLVYIKDNGEWSEYFLSDLYRYIQCHRNTGVKIIGEYYTAIRREEAEGFTGIELYEKNEVRAIRYLHKKVSKKYILFGCGDIGQIALEYFGKENVYCFVDNNLGMVGKIVCEKEVISYEKFTEICNNYITVITTKDSFMNEIIEQLKKCNIFDYFLFKGYAKKDENPYWESGYQIICPGTEKSL